MGTTELRISWTVSRARDTYGYNVCTLTDKSTGKRYRCNGGGYDMVGTVFGAWLADTQQSALVRLADKHGPSSEHRGQVADWYGMYRWEPNGPVMMDGACGIESMQRVARELGLTLERTYVRTGPNRGEATGWVVTTPDSVIPRPWESLDDLRSDLRPLLRAGE